MLVRGRFRDIRPFVYGKVLGGIIKKTFLMFPEQGQSPKTYLRMFKLDNELILKKNTCNRNDHGA